MQVINTEEMFHAADFLLNNAPKPTLPNLSCLKKDGVCVCVIYPGHDMGFQESEEIEQFVQQLDQKEYEVLKYTFMNQIHYPPYLIAIQKLKEEIA